MNNSISINTFFIIAGMFYIYVFIFYPMYHLFRRLFLQYRIASIGSPKTRPADSKASRSGDLFVSVGAGFGKVLECFFFVNVLSFGNRREGPCQSSLRVRSFKCISLCVLREFKYFSFLAKVFYWVGYLHIIILLFKCCLNNFRDSLLFCEFRHLFV